MNVDAPQTSMTYSHEVSEGWSDDGYLGGREAGLEGKWYWHGAGEAFRRQYMQLMAVHWLERNDLNIGPKGAKFRGIRR